VRLLSLLVLVFAWTARADSWRVQRLAAEVEKDPRNLMKILQLAAAKLDDASGVQGEADRESALDEVQILYLRAQSIDPQNFDAVYHLGVVSWMKVFPAVVAARREAVMDPDTPGPVRDRAARAVLNAKYRADIDYAIATLEQAVALDPSSNAAMAYLQMAYRARADFKDTRTEWDLDQNAASEWREKAYEVALKPPAPPVPKLDVEPASPVMMFPGVVHLRPQEMSRKLLTFVSAACPQGTVGRTPPPVSLSAVIDRDGSVLYLEKVGDADEGTAEAIAAARSWIYAPTLMNGSSVRVRTTISVPFRSCE